MPHSGRPRALDEFKQREVCALVSAGCGIEGAASYIGVNPITIRREALRNPDFHEKLRNAELASQLEPLHAMRRAASTHWRAAAWILERTNPSRFGRRDPDSLTPAQVKSIMTRVVEGIVDEFPDADTAQRVCDRVAAMARELSRENRAATHTRRDPHSARRRAVASRPKPFPPSTIANEQNDIVPADRSVNAPTGPPTITGPSTIND
jgi:hypothetical protein